MFIFCTPMRHLTGDSICEFWGTQTACLAPKREIFHHHVSGTHSASCQQQQPSPAMIINRPIRYTILHDTIDSVQRVSKKATGEKSNRKYRNGLRAVIYLSVQNFHTAFVFAITRWSFFFLSQMGGRFRKKKTSLSIYLSNQTGQ